MGCDCIIDRSAYFLLLVGRVLLATSPVGYLSIAFHLLLVIRRFCVGKVQRAVACVVLVGTPRYARLAANAAGAPHVGDSSNDWERIARVVELRLM